MFETSILNALGQWPIIQFAVALVVLFGGVFALRRGEKDKGKQDNADEDKRQELRDQIAAALLRDTTQKLRDDVAKVLEANREAFFKSLHDQDREFSRLLGDLSDRLRTVEIEHAAFKERLAARGRE